MSDGFAPDGADSPRPGAGARPGERRELAGPVVPPYPADLAKACWQLTAAPRPVVASPGPGEDGGPGRPAGPGDDGGRGALAGLADRGERSGPGDRGEQGLAGPGEHGELGLAATGDPLLPGDYALAGLTGRRSRRRLLSRLALTIVATALTAALAGGLVGGYIESRASSPAGLDPGFSLGAVPPVVTDRPPDSVAGIASRVLPSVVMIKVNGTQGTGSGFVIKGGYIITDNHVITLDGQLRHAALQVVFEGGKAVPAKVVGTDPYSDIAVIRADSGTGLPALALGNSGSVRVGDPVIAFGSPLGLAGTVTSGIVSALARPVQPSSSSGGAAGSPQVFFDAIQTDAPINPGNSGGPLVNGQGQVIGINSAIDTLGGNPLTGNQGGSIGLGFAIPINQARLVATQLIRTGRATHAIIGAEISSAYSGAGAQIARRHRASGPAISPHGPAARAGLRPGDVIVSFGGQRISNSTGLLDAIRSFAPGTRVTVRFTRNGVSHTATLTLGAAES
ncbi:MAG TPA: trypsin-like peptidase domain-containing protein [Streptosporangiaceae bacterium]|jgi:putative serine protease PepD